MGLLSNPGQSAPSPATEGSAGEGEGGEVDRTGGSMMVALLFGECYQTNFAILVTPILD
jgi:hypothetical protein